MVLSLIFGKKYASLEVGTITFDNNISEEHRFSSRVTSYPVESGTIMTDHILNLPDTIVISGLVTDTPLNMFFSFNRSIDAFNRLVAIHEKREVVKVQTGLKTYNNMAIVTLDVPRNMKTGQTLTFNIELQRITFSDVLDLQVSPDNILAGIQQNRSSQVVKQNTDIPTLSTDPENSLKDQASSTVNVGVQSLVPVPVSSVLTLTQQVAVLKGLI